MKNLNKRELIAGSAIAVAATAMLATSTAAQSAPVTSGLDCRDITVDTNFFHNILDRMLDAELDGNDVGEIHVTRAGFKKLAMANQIDYIPDGEGVAFATVIGRRVYVPGSALAKK